MSHTADFEAMVRQCQAELFALLLARSPDREVAKDLLQDVLLNAWRRRHTLLAMPGDQRRRYLFTMAKNRAIDEARRKPATGASLTDLPAKWDAAAPPPARDDDRLDPLQRCIDRLPPGDRELLMLSALGDLAADELADRLESAASTIRSRLTRLRAKLRACVSAQKRKADDPR